MVRQWDSSRLTRPQTRGQTRIETSPYYELDLAGQAHKKKIPCWTRKCLEHNASLLDIAYNRLGSQAIDSRSLPDCRKCSSLRRLFSDLLEPTALYSLDRDNLPLSLFPPLSIDEGVSSSCRCI
jgi:hypothetical protein